jgi:hypothetical protein
MASGMVVSAPVERPHWNPQKADTLVWKVEVDFDTILEPAPGILLPRDLLETGELQHVDWRHQRSGISIPAESAAELETLWADWLDKRSAIGQKIRVYFDSLEPGEVYDRPELAALWGYKDWHAIGRGIVTPAGHKAVILFVTKEKQEALTQYEDHFDGDLLHMQGETNHAADQRLVNAASAGDEIHLFYRDQHHTDFTYYGEVSLREQDLRETEPCRFVFTTSKWEADAASAIASELRAHGGFENDFVGDAEGRRVLRLHVTYERSRLGARLHRGPPHQVHHRGGWRRGESRDGSGAVMLELPQHGAPRACAYHSPRRVAEPGRQIGLKDLGINGTENRVKGTRVLQALSPGLGGSRKATFRYGTSLVCMGFIYPT